MVYLTFYLVKSSGKLEFTPSEKKKTIFLGIKGLSNSTLAKCIHTFRNV